MQMICGVDACKAWLDAWVTTGVFQRFSNDESGVAALGDFCREHGVELVVFEASGGVEQAAFLTLW